MGGNGVEDVDKEEEEDDEEAHSTSNLVHRDQEWHPGYDDKQTWGVKNVSIFWMAWYKSELTRGKEVGDDVGGDMSRKHLTM